MTKKLLSFLAMAMLCTASLIAQDEPQERTLRVVTYNVDGLPAQTPLLNLNVVNSNSPGSEGSEMMGELIRGLNPDLIAVEEDFDFNGSFARGLGNGYSQGWWRGAFAWSGISIRDLRLNSDGLNLFWKEGTVPVAKGSESCVMFNERYGTLTSGSDAGFDQHIAKGFRYYRAKVKDQNNKDASIDIFLTHMDAGSSDGDINAKDLQFTQMKDYILNTGNRPKIVMGDFNSRYTREKIYENFIKPLEDAGFEVHDAWVERYRSNYEPKYPNHNTPNLADETKSVNSGDREIVDKIFYINPKTTDGIKLVLKDFFIQEGFTDHIMSSNNPSEHIGDHDPVIADFKVVGTQKTVDISSQWVWKGEEKKSNGFYYILSYLCNAFIQPGSEVKLTPDVTKADLIQLEGNNEPYLLKKSNGYYITWGGRGDEFNLNVNRKDPLTLTLPLIGTITAKNNLYENYYFTNNVKDTLDIYYMIYYNGIGSYAYLETNGKGENAGLTKQVSSQPSDDSNRSLVKYNWKLISEAQKQTYLAYKAALEKALEYVTTYIASDRELEKTLMAELDNKEQRWWYHDKVTEFIELVAGLDFANLTINKNAVDELNPDPYGTFVAPYPVKLPASVNAYVIEADNEKNIINLTTKYENESTIPACTPVLLVSKKPEGQSTIMYYGKCVTDVCEPEFTYSTGSLTYKDGVELYDTKNDVTHHNKMYTCKGKAGDLEGSFVYQNLPDAAEGKNFYLLQKQNVDGKDKVAFYLCKTPHSLYTTGKNRCWLVKSGDTGNGTIGTQAKQAFYFQLWDDDADAITKVETEDNMHKTVIYDLSGRRVTNPQRGIYIINGKKVYINK